jgi:uridylate kinase
MFVHHKQSGELLASQGQPGDLWTAYGVLRSAEKIASAYKIKDAIGLSGLLLVSGAGNIIRGEELRGKRIADGMADVLGRLATVQNTIVLSQALNQRNVPTKVFVADGMRIQDGSLPKGYLEPYDVEAVREAYEKERVVLVAGGTGEDNKTTDNAVLEYARRFRAFSQDTADVLVLKGTKHDGVFDGDPATNADARRYLKVSAGYMLANYASHAVVDRPALETIKASGIALRVYADGQHDLQTAMRGTEVGTLIVPGAEPPIFEA